MIIPHIDQSGTTILAVHEEYHSPTVVGHVADNDPAVIQQYMDFSPRPKERRFAVRAQETAMTTTPGSTGRARDFAVTEADFAMHAAQVIDALEDKGEAHVSAQALHAMIAWGDHLIMHARMGRQRWVKVRSQEALKSWTAARMRLRQAAALIAELEGSWVIWAADVDVEAYRTFQYWLGQENQLAESARR